MSLKTTILLMKLQEPITLQCIAVLKCFIVRFMMK